MLATLLTAQSVDLGYEPHLCNRAPQQGNPGNMRHLARSFAASLLIAALLTPASHAQSLPESERQKAEEARKKAEEKATDEAYKATLKSTGLGRVLASSEVTGHRQEAAVS